MATATSYDLPQYLGELFRKGKRPNAVLMLLGGLGRFRPVTTTEYAMGVDYTISNGAQPAILEGAAATPSTTSTSQSSNVVQIFQESAELTYSRLAAQGTISGVAAIPGRGNGEVQKPGTLEWQIARKLEKMAQDANYTFLRGAYQKPTDNTTARKTRGFRTAATTNVFANGGTGRAITKAILNAALKDSMENGMFNRGDVLKVFGDADQVDALIALYESDTQQPISREEAGVSIRRIHTKWAVLDVIWEPDTASGELVIWRPEMCQPVALEIPGKGTLFAEPLAKTASKETVQLYGELGIDYTHEVFVAVIDDLL
jgi:hypothetical protein